MATRRHMRPKFLSFATQPKKGNSHHPYHLMTLKAIIRIWALASLLIILAGGYFFHLMPWNAFLQDALQKAACHNQIVTDRIDAHLEDQQKAVAVFSMVPALHEALKKRDIQSIHQANAFLDLYQKTFGAGVSFLLDHEGNTIASSNRQSAGSFIGHTQTGGGRAA